MFCFFKHKTAYECRISDWSSDVCSSDIMAQRLLDPMKAMGIDVRLGAQAARFEPGRVFLADESSIATDLVVLGLGVSPNSELGEAAGDRQRVVQGTSVSVRVDLGGTRFITNTTSLHITIYFTLII